MSGRVVWNASVCCPEVCWQLGLTVLAGHGSLLTRPLLTSVLCCHPFPQQRESGRHAYSLLREQLEYSLQLFRQNIDIVSLNSVLSFIGFFTLHAVLKSYSWASCTSLTGHLVQLQTVAHLEAAFEAHDFRYDNSALLRLAVCLGFVSSFVHVLCGFRYLFSVFQKTFVYVLPLCVILQGNFLPFVCLLLIFHRSGIWCKTCLKCRDVDSSSCFLFIADFYLFFF